MIESVLTMPLYLRKCDYQKIITFELIFKNIDFYGP